eukprot:7377187-Prymnesium_polylepis.3
MAAELVRRCDGCGCGCASLWDVSCDGPCGGRGLRAGRGARDATPAVALARGRTALDRVQYEQRTVRRSTAYPVLMPHGTGPRASSS